MQIFNWFAQNGADYACFRPSYPKQLIKFLTKCCANTELAVDVGCGNGQLSLGLVDYFTQVIAVDSSQSQLQNATRQTQIQYLCALAEQLPIKAHSASLITVAQAAHWFNLDKFYPQVSRIAQPGAVLALISYGVLNLDAELNERFKVFYYDEIGQFWPKERALVDSGYKTLSFPFNVLSYPEFSIKQQWNLNQFLGYINTWSAVIRTKQQGKKMILQEFAQDMQRLWGHSEQKRMINWPINLRLAKLTD